MGFPSQEYRSGSPFPPPGDLPDPGIEPTSPALAGRFLTTEPLESWTITRKTRGNAARQCGSHGSLRKQEPTSPASGAQQSALTLKPSKAKARSSEPSS